MIMSTKKEGVAMIDPVILKAIIVAIGISIPAGILGCFVIWNKMAYFGDAVSHSSLLGIALGLLFAINIDFAVIAACAIFGIALVWLKNNRYFTTDSLLGILAHSSLAIGMLIISITQDHEIDVHNFLFGDILQVSNLNLIVILVSAAIIAILITLKWQPLCLTTICRDIAKAEGVNIFKMDLLLILLLSIFVAISIKIFGILLVTSMLIIPSASARQVASSPKSMAFLAIIFAALASIVGIFLAINYKIDSGPVIVVSSVVILAVTSVISSLRKA